MSKKLSNYAARSWRRCSEKLKPGALNRTFLLWERSQPFSRTRSRPGGNAMTRTPSRPVAVAATTALLAAVALAATVLVPHLRPVATAQVAARADPRVEQLLA